MNEDERIYRILQWVGLVMLSTMGLGLLCGALVLVKLTLMFLFGW